MMLKQIMPLGGIMLLGLAGAGAQMAQSSPMAEEQVPHGSADGTGSLAATIAAMPRNLPRAAAPALEASIRAAQAAQVACMHRGAKVSVLVADVQGRPVVLLSGDGAGFRSQLIAQTKANIVARWRQPSIAVADRAGHDPALAAQAAADPQIGMLRGGGLPVMRKGTMIGIVAVSGASLEGGDLTLDEQCARVAVSSLEAG
ncbi:heme-binding protein [Novosphingobium terrae]|uniref:heme-binding protein n=1 Tax=Novosphingobium terrae TaxID=2726189 RepID=UPI00197DC80D|nr:heme-binding protein [Novosphingobium terrae]